MREHQFVHNKLEPVSTVTGGGEIQIENVTQHQLVREKNKIQTHQKMFGTFICV